jgi:hypothetical protein
MAIKVQVGSFVEEWSPEDLQSLGNQRIVCLENEAREAKDDRIEALRAIEDEKSRPLRAKCCDTENKRFFLSDDESMIYTCSKCKGDVVKGVCLRKGCKV